MIFNFSRAGVVDDAAVCEAIKAGRVNGYVCDFPTNFLIGHEKVITLPHLGASTKEAEENCAVMVADQVRVYLEDGTVHHSVNFPEMEMPRNGGHRVLVVNSNVPGMIECISKAIASVNLNIVDLLNKSRGDIACTLVDVNSPVPQTVVDCILAQEGVLTVRML
jgi:D-3-phosphoglycerate dehydrogenase